MCFVSVYGNNVFQDIRVKRRVVCVCVLYVNMQKNEIENFDLRIPLSQINITEIIRLSTLTNTKKKI